LRNGGNGGNFATKIVSTKPFNFLERGNWHENAGSKWWWK